MAGIFYLGKNFLNGHLLTFMSSKSVSTFFSFIEAIKLSILPIALILTVFIMNFLGYFGPGAQTVQFSRDYNIVGGSTYCVMAATNIIATSVIAAKIYSSINLNREVRRRYKHIIEITTQSSASYTRSTVATAVTGLINNADIRTYRSDFFNAEAYTNAIACFTTVCSTYLIYMIP